MVYLPGLILTMIYSPCSSETVPTPSSLTKTLTPIIDVFVFKSVILPDIFPDEANNALRENNIKNNSLMFFFIYLNNNVLRKYSLNYSDLLKIK